MYCFYDGAAVVQWNHACFGIRGISKRTGSNPVHGPSQGLIAPVQGCCELSIKSSCDLAVSQLKGAVTAWPIKTTPASHKTTYTYYTWRLQVQPRSPTLRRGPEMSPDWTALNDDPKCFDTSLNFFLH
ncbi:hypothetical protein E2C01_004317 [Portunus trituberculatus]|uniref:Uncharacterized protein n=1 Tax=Portunus trituberculatus TaxID=210409 RepID=A0A5B7CTQ6_PORTR|nr:hypothetical protein [Portunus trituberculatus]